MDVTSSSAWAHVLSKFRILPVSPSWELMWGGSMYTKVLQSNILKPPLFYILKVQKIKKNLWKTINTQMSYPFWEPLVLLEPFGVRIGVLHETAHSSGPPISTQSSGSRKRFFQFWSAVCAFWSRILSLYVFQFWSFLFFSFEIEMLYETPRALRTVLMVLDGLSYSWDNSSAVKQSFISPES